VEGGTVPERIFIGLGSNMGDSLALLGAALRRLEHRGLRVVSCSSPYRTAPFGPVEQPDFTNLAVELASSLAPDELLDILLQTEQELGRVRDVRWGPRTVDLDLLFYGERILDLLAVTGDHKCKVQSAKCKVQNGQASWLSATIRLRTTLRRDFGDHPPSHDASAGLRRPSAFAGRFGGTSSPIMNDRRSRRPCLDASTPRLAGARSGQADHRLVLPHPGIPERGFVLVPMLEIAPDFVHPILSKTIRELWEAWRQRSEHPDRLVRRLEEIPPGFWKEGT
jgi:2-amino-4-hydroxy-6-hydroxymethyldihydropteridine diphosphokinase